MKFLLRGKKRARQKMSPRPERKPIFMDFSFANIPVDDLSKKDRRSVN